MIKEYCKGCGIVIMIKSGIIDTIMNKESDDFIEFKDGIYCVKCGKKKQAGGKDFMKCPICNAEMKNITSWADVEFICEECGKFLLF